MAVSLPSDDICHTPINQTHFITTVTYLQPIILFITTLLSGCFILWYPNKMPKHSSLILTFGGSFLFSLTLLHVLPDLYHHVRGHHYLLYFLLVGFFFQFFLDLLSHGIAHGHVHEAHSYKPSRTAFGLFMALFIHAIFDGILVSGANHGHDGHEHGLLGGIVLHKIPATFALMSVLVQYKYKVRTMAIYLFLFALASPIGYFLPSLLQGTSVFGEKSLLAFFALAVGNLLHIATTILAEATADHRFNISKIMAYLVGALFAVMADMY